MTSTKLSEALAREKSNLKRLETKKAEIEEKIKKTQAKISEYEIMENSIKFGAISDIVKKSGLSIEDVLIALQSGDLLALQEQMDAAQKKDSSNNNPEV